MRQLLLILGLQSVLFFGVKLCYVKQDMSGTISTHLQDPLFSSCKEQLPIRTKGATVCLVFESGVCALKLSISSIVHKNLQSIFLGILLCHNHPVLDSYPHTED